MIMGLMLFGGVCAALAIVGFHNLRAVRKPSKKRVHAATA
jgi:hypothetical protein